MMLETALDSSSRFLNTVWRLRLLWLLFLPHAPLLAQPAPKLATISPTWIQRGTTLDLTLTGENLGGVAEFIFNGDAGLTASNVPPAAPGPKPTVIVESTGGGIARAEPTVPARDEKRIVLRVTASMDASLAARELRVRTPGGVSNPLNLNVGQWPEVARREPNGTLAEAQRVELPAVISGVLNTAAQTNLYRFKATKGEELVFEVEAARRGSPLDSSLLLLDPDGKELARNEDALGLDSLLHFTAPADGDYIVGLRDFRYRGGGDYSYRLTAGPVPYVERLFPFGGSRGKSVEVAITGRNLDGTTRMNLAIDPKARRAQEIRVKTPRGYSNLVPFDVSDLLDVTEAEPNDAFTNAQAIPIPAVINGRVGAARDSDRFKFKSDKDQKLVCEVAAGRFGSKLDALLILSDTNLALLQQNDDAMGSDARLEFDAKKGVEYYLTLRDLTGRGGETFGYRLSVRPPSAGAGASFVARYLPDAVRVHREGTTRIRCEVTREGGFDGPVRFEFSDLPSGVFAEPLVIPNAPHSGLLVIAATRQAALGSYPLRLTASATIGGKTVTLPVEPLIGDKVVREGYLTVLDTVPYSIGLATLGVALEQNQAGTFDIVAQRREGFTGEIKLFTEGYSAARDPASKSFNGGESVIKAGEILGKISLTPKLDSEVGARTVIVRGEAMVDGQAVVTYTEPMPVSVAQYPLLLSSTLTRLAVAVLPPGSTSAAGEAETKIKVERRAGFAGDVELVIEGLPPGIKSELGKIPAALAETTLKLNATEKAGLGTNFTFTVVGKALFNDRNYTTRTGKIALSVNAPEQIELATNGPPVTATVPATK